MKEILEKRIRELEFLYTHQFSKRESIEELLKLNKRIYLVAYGSEYAKQKEVLH